MAKTYKEYLAEETLLESGIQNIKKIAKENKKFYLLFHQDLDGVTSAIGIKAYLEGQGMKMADCNYIQYGGTEYTVDKGPKDAITVLVDFAHGKPTVKIHLDHHDGQVGVGAGTSTNFKKASSNAMTISNTVSPRELFPQKDLKIISMVDSAIFRKNGISPDEVMNSVFHLKSTKSLKLNHQEMGLVVNKTLLAFKNKPKFLKTIVEEAKPSLISMYNVIVKTVKKLGYASADELMVKGSNYVAAQNKNTETIQLKDVSKLKSGHHGMIDYKVVAQYGGGAMMKGGYDRYVPFKLHPDAVLFTIAWPMGLIQASMNPFITNPVNTHLGKAVMAMLDKKWKSKFKKKQVSLDFIKWTFEKDATKQRSKGVDPIGFNMSDILALVDRKQLANLGKEGTSWDELITKMTDTPYSKLSRKQTALLGRITVNLWDMVMAGSGGHPAITNISGLGFWGKGYVDAVIHPMQQDIAEVLQDLCKKAGVAK